MNTLSDRMKGYERATGTILPKNTPIILRIDGRAFHTFTGQFKSPFDECFMDMMNTIGKALCEEIMNARIAYLQSDEISILIYDTIYSDTWFGNNVQKMTSISASLASTVATRWLIENGYKNTNVTFDSRVFAVPEKDVTNYFLWRQRDWERNSIHMQTRGCYSQAELQNKSVADMHELLHKKGHNWDKLRTYWKRGRCITKVTQIVEHNGISLTTRTWSVDDEMPILSKDREYIESRIREANEVKQ